ncbi:M23 family metallopeptidase [Microbacterium sp. P03]|uniref:M23 family metallopeptidase n=1 Tax=Microbacterium sp. P03 TaxID=3366946 RepID=UPI003746F8D8
MRSLPAAAALAAASVLLVACTASTPPPTSTVSAAGSVADVPDDRFTPVIGEVISVPRGVPTTDGRVHIAYELHLRNVTSQTATIASVDVLDQTGSSLERLDGDDVLPWVHVSGATAATRTLGPGQGALVWLDVVVDSMDALPTTLAHVVTLRFDPGALPIIPNEMTERLAVTTVDAAPAVVIGPPLEGAGWLNGNSCCTVTPHRAAVNPINGSLHAPERYAIDYVRLDDEGSFRDGPADDLSSYPYYGASILAVGDGPIVSMRFDLPEQTPGANPSGLTLDEYGGNHIVQDLGNGVYAFYAHLQTGNPVQVEVGQQLKKGEEIALLGNTGNTDSPHLHFHLMDSPSPLGSNGIPFVYDSFTLQGSITADDLDAGIDEGGPFTIDSGDAGSETDLYPIWLSVTDYPTPAK